MTTPTHDSTATPTPETPQAAGTFSSPIVAALEATWAAIQARHPQVPAVVIVLASGSLGMPRGVLRLGHFAAMRWHHDHAAGRLPEVFVGGEGLARGPVDVLGTLLHEATHALAHVRGIQECSRQGRYHNARFRDLATELGLRVEQVPMLGWSDTYLTDHTTLAYSDQIAQLGTALTIHRYAEGHPTAPTANTPDDPGTDEPAGSQPRRASTTCRCACPRRIRVAPTIHALGPITCRVCGQDFSPTT